MKITNTIQRKIEIGKYDPISKVDIDTGEEVDLAEILSDLFEEGDIVKVQITRVQKEEEEA